MQDNNILMMCSSNLIFALNLTVILTGTMTVWVVRATLLIDYTERRGDVGNQTLQSAVMP
jgi:hypothetical protein